MNFQKSPFQLIWKSSIIILLVLLAFQSLGMNGLAAPAALSPLLQTETPEPMPLTCGSSAATPTYCNIQIVLMIDDSGSMRTNDPGALRNQGAINLVNILADQYYSAAQTLKEDNESFRLPDVRVAVIHFSRGVKRNSGWIPIDPNNLDQWKSDLNAEINWPPRGTKEYTDFYARKQYTSFSEAFGFARRLLSSSDVQGEAGDCTRRSILLFTDGTPENERGILTGNNLKDEMDSVEATTTSLQNALPADSKVKIYITGFKIDSKYWSQVEGRWDTIAQPPETSDISTSETQEYVELIGGTNVSLDELPARMEAITASLVDIRRFAVNQSGSEAKTVIIPTHIESVRFTLYNSDTAANLEITGPDGNAITIDSPEVSDVSGQGTPIQVWQLNRPAAGTYTIRAQNAKRPGIITWLLAYQGISATFDNPPGSFEPGKEGTIQFSLTDSASTSVLADQDGLDINVSITQLGGETISQVPTLTDGKYNVSWTPKNSRPAEFTVSLTDPRANLGLNCSLVFDFISTTPPTDTPTPTPTTTPTSTPVTPVTVVPPTETTPVPVVAILPQCVPSGENVSLPMRLEYGDAKAFPDSLKWKVTSTDPDINVSVNPINAKEGEFELRLSPVSEKAGPIQLQLEAVDTAGGQAEPFFVIDSPPLTVCEIPPICDCEAPPIWLIFIWLMMWLFLLLLGWIILRDVKINIKFWLLVALEIVLAVVWFIYFSGYLTYLFWMLLLIILLIILAFIFRKIFEDISWWLIILLTLFISIWFVLFGNFPFWLILLLLLMWLAFLILIWIFKMSEPPSWRWLLILLLLILALLSIIIFSAYWIFLLLWLLTILVLTLMILVIGPICPPIPPPVPADDLKDLEGIEGGVENLLNDHGIYTFRQLAEADISQLNEWLNENDWKYMDPKTWPQQAKLADIAKRYGKKEDEQSYKAYKKWLKNGIEPDEYEDKEKVRRAEALVWRGTAELTEKDNPDIFNIK